MSLSYVLCYMLHRIAPCALHGCCCWLPCMRAGGRHGHPAHSAVSGGVHAGFATPQAAGHGVSPHVLRWGRPSLLILFIELWVLLVLAARRCAPRCPAARMHVMCVSWRRGRKHVLRNGCMLVSMVLGLVPIMIMAVSGM